MNPHGYQDKEHYTTAYDLYLIFKECIKEDLFVDIISSTTRTAIITEKSGSQRTVTTEGIQLSVNGPDRIVGHYTLAAKIVPLSTV